MRARGLKLRQANERLIGMKNFEKTLVKKFRDKITSYIYKNRAGRLENHPLVNYVHMRKLYRVIVISGGYSGFFYSD